MLHEMGFGIDLMCFDPQGELEEECCRLLDSLSEGTSPHRARSFETPEELERYLDDPQLSAVFSEYFYDWRLTSKGVGQFHLAFFQTGIQGALESLEQILDVCSNTFYRRYGRYLKRAQYD